MILILLGPPGAGKGTQGRFLADEYGIPEISSGDILRAEVAGNTKLGRQAKSYMDKGELVPDGIIVAMMADRISKEDCKPGFILDGFPRTIDQAGALADMLKELGRSVDFVLNIDISEERVIKRISGRRSCPNCSSVYNVHCNPPKKDGICDNCGNELIQRIDDSESTVLNRLKIYNKQTKPIIDCYDKRSLLRTVDGEPKPDVILDDILNLLNR